MKKFFLLLSLIMLAACTTKYKDVDKKNEQIQAMLFSQNKLYLLGKEQDYQFDDEEKDILELQGFLESPLAKQASIETEDFKVYNNNEIQVGYSIFIKMATLSQQQIRLLKDKYDFYQPYVSNPAEAYMANNYRLTGKLVKLANRQELLAKYALPKPLETQIAYIKRYEGVDTGFIKHTVTEIILLPLTIPVLIMLSQTPGSIGGTGLPR